MAVPIRKGKAPDAAVGPPVPVTGPEPASAPTLLSAGQAMLRPLAATLLLVALSAVPSVWNNPHTRWSFWGAAVGLAVFNLATFAAVVRSGRTLAVEVLIRKQHWMQACAHSSILLYWGWYWRTVYDSAPLFAGQLAFAYAFDMLLQWNRRDTYTLGFGPFPIIFSTNLFLWFKPDWFYLQFLMVAVGFMAKELIRWKKEGRLTHIFNPSSFTLALFSLGLILTGSTGITWGREIAGTQFNPPHIYLWIFAVTLPAQFLFGTAAMTWAAVATTYGFCVAYFAATGSHFFPELPIPIAVFLGMHLLFTDPSTSPRTELGRLIFGVLYGLSVVGVAAFLTYLKVPPFYDKLLPVPFLNLTIRAIDRAVRSDWLKRFDPASLGRSLVPRMRNVAYMTLWAATFATMQFMTGTQATLVRADALLDQGRIDDAIGRYREYTTTDPNDPEGHNNLGVALMQGGRLDEAMQSFQRSLELRPDSSKTQNNLGVVLMRMGRLDQAIAPLQRAIDLEPTSPGPYESLGQLRMRTGQFGEAVDAFQHAKTLQPDRSEAHASLGLALLQAGQFDKALPELERAAALQPDSPEAQGNLAVALARAGRTSDAIAALQRAADLQPASGEARASLGQALMQSGRLAEGVAAFQRAAELQPTLAEAHDNLGQALLQTGRFEAAATSLRRAVELKPDFAQAHYDLAHALTSLHQSKAAVAELQAALRAQPDWPPAMESLAWLEATDPDALDPEDAIRVASRAADGSANRDPRMLDVLAAAYAAAGRYPEAARTAERAEALASADPQLASEIRARLAEYRTKSAK